MLEKKEVTSSSPMILLVEDDFLNRSMMFRFLVRLGYRVVLATNGHDGISLAKHLIPDLVIMDIDLPVVHGHAAVQEIKEWGNTSSVPVLCISAHATQTDADEAFEIGCDDYESKPFLLQNFAAKIENLLGLSPA